MSSPSKRREMDVMKLMMTDYKVEMINDGMSEFFVEFKGPQDIGTLIVMILIATISKGTTLVQAPKAIEI